MILLGHILTGISAVLGLVLWWAMLVLIARAVISWVSPDPRNPIVAFLVGVTEPMLAPIRRKIPPIGMLDMSVLVVILGIMFLRSAVVPYLAQVGQELKAPSVAEAPVTHSDFS